MLFYDVFCFGLDGLYYLTIQKALLSVWIYPYVMTFRYGSNSAVFCWIGSYNVENSRINVIRRRKHYL